MILGIKGGCANLRGCYTVRGTSKHKTMQRFRADVIKRGIRPVDHCLRLTVISKNSFSCSQFLRARVKPEMQHSCSWEPMCNLTSPKLNLSIIQFKFHPPKGTSRSFRLSGQPGADVGSVPRLRLKHMAAPVATLAPKSFYMK